MMRDIRPRFPALARLAARLPLANRFVREDGGLAAVEFALIVPIMVSAYLGSVDLTQAIIVDRKVSVVTSSIGDLVAQTDVIDSGEMDNILDIAAALMAPYDPGPIAMRVTSLEITATQQGDERKAKVLWSDGRHMAPHPVNAEILVPENIAKNATTVIYTEGSYTFTPLFGQIITSTLTMEDEYFHIPRKSASVEYN